MIKTSAAWAWITLTHIQIIFQKIIKIQVSRAQQNVCHWNNR